MPIVKPIIIDAGAEPRQTSSGGGEGGGGATGGGLCELNGMVTAQAVAQLDAEVSSLRQLIIDMLSGNHQFDVILTQNIRVNGADLQVSGVDVPRTEPDFIGQQYIDTVHKVAYIATGNSSSGDWKPITTPQ